MPKTILIKWNRPNLYRCGDFRVIPGVNEVRQEIWDAVKDNPGVKQRIEDKWITFVGAPPASAKPKDPEGMPDGQDDGDGDGEDGGSEGYSLKDYNAAEAIDIVKEMLDLETLKKWEAEEERKTVLAAIAGQIELVTQPDDDEGNGDGDGEDGGEE